LSGVEVKPEALLDALVVRDVEEPRIFPARTRSCDFFDAALVAAALVKATIALIPTFLANIDGLDALAWFTVHPVAITAVTDFGPLGALLVSQQQWGVLNRSLAVDEPQQLRMPSSLWLGAVCRACELVGGLLDDVGDQIRMDDQGHVARSDAEDFCARSARVACAFPCRTVWTSQHLGLTSSTTPR
jgi:hypothetical protein